MTATAAQRSRDAAPLTFVVYAVLTGLAAVPTWLAQRAVEQPLAAGDRRAAHLLRPGGAVLLEVVQAADFTGVGFVWLASMGVLLVLSPWLSMAWLGALARPADLRPILRRGLRLYWPAVGTSLLTALVSLPALGLATVPMVTAHHAIAVRPDPRPHDVAVAALSLLPAATAAAAFALHDLSRAALVVRGRRPLRALREGLRNLRARVLAGHVGWLAFGTACIAAGHLVAAMAAGAGIASELLALAASQLGLLGRVWARGRWLATAVHRTALGQGNQT